MKDRTDVSTWYRNVAETQIAIHQRSMRTHSGEPVLKYFDGSIMKGYQVPHRVFQTIFCRQHATSAICESGTENRKDVSESNLEVKMSSIGDGSGRGVFTKINIERGMTIGRESSANPLIFPPSTTSLIVDNRDKIEGLDVVYDYMDGYGWQTEAFVSEVCQSMFVDFGLKWSFINTLLAKIGRTIVLC